MMPKKGEMKMKKTAHPLQRTVFVSFVISVVLCAAVILAADDAFALTGGDESETVVIPEGAATEEVARVLGQAGLIRFPYLYRLYAALRSWERPYLNGEFTLRRDMSYDELRAALSPGRGARSQTRITIPEGLTTDEIIDIFLSNGIGTREGFVRAIETGGDFGYDFLRELTPVQGRTYRLDGYLFPDTYFFYTDSSEEEVLAKLLANFDRKMDESLRAYARERGFSVDEIVRLASIVEREAYYRSDMPQIASVFCNRLQNRAYPYLQSDATVQYAKETLGLAGAPTAEDLDELETPYNTYLTRGLPPGAICSPGKDALMAVLYPADTDYYYFVSAEDKTTIFSKTYAEHLRAIAKLRGSP